MVEAYAQGTLWALESFTRDKCIKDVHALLCGLVICNVDLHIHSLVAKDDLSMFSFGGSLLVCFGESFEISIWAHR